jgi:hypothetical protein
LLGQARFEFTQNLLKGSSKRTHLYTRVDNRCVSGIAETCRGTGPAFIAELADFRRIRQLYRVGARAHGSPLPHATGDSIAAAHGAGKGGYDRAGSVLGRPPLSCSGSSTTGSCGEGAKIEAAVDVVKAESFLTEM